MQVSRLSMPLVFALILLSFGLAVGANAQSNGENNGANTERVCHARGNNEVAPQNVSPDALQGHLQHGDARPGDEFPGSVGGSVYGENCEEVVIGDRVCCARGDREWFTTQRRCRRDGGRVVPERRCYSN